MPEDKAKQVALSCEIRFSKALKRKKDRDSAYARFISLVEENLESFPFQTSFNKKRRQVVFNAENFLIIVIFSKLPTTTIMVNEPHENISVANEASNKIINYLNTVLGEIANDVGVRCMLDSVIEEKKTVNLADKLIGERRIAKINELLKQTLKPLVIGFQFKEDERTNAIMSMSNGTTAQGVFTTAVYKGKLPFNLLEKEIKALDNPAEIIKKLTEMEL